MMPREDAGDRPQAWFGDVVRDGVVIAQDLPLSEEQP